MVVEGALSLLRVGGSRTLGSPIRNWIFSEGRSGNSLAEGGPRSRIFSGRTPYTNEIFGQDALFQRGHFGQNSPIPTRTFRAERPRAKPKQTPGKETPRPAKIGLWFVCAKAGPQARNTAPFPHCTGAKAGSKAFHLVAPWAKTPVAIWSPAMAGI